jgi:prepilin-type processing-associated H-X9-DG protein
LSVGARNVGRYDVNYQQFLGFRHNYMANAVYCDGHVRADDQSWLYMGHPLAYPYNYCLEGRAWFAYPGRLDWAASIGYYPYD